MRSYVRYDKRLPKANVAEISLTRSSIESFYRILREMEVVFWRSAQRTTSILRNTEEAV